MDDITYTAFEIANKIETTNESDLINKVKDKFTPSRFTEIEKTIRTLFVRYNGYFESILIGNIIPQNPRDKMRLTLHAKNLFLEEKYKRDSEDKRMSLEMSKLETDTFISKRIFKTYWWTFGFAVAAFLISLVLLILKIIEISN